MHNRLSVENLFKAYNKRLIVDNVSFYVDAGEIVALLGPNGAGKTTCFYITSGLIRPDKGSIILNGHNVTGFPLYQLARLGLGYLPQEFSIFRGLTVEQNIAAVLEIVEDSKEKRRLLVERFLKDFDILSVRKCKASTLSGGERRRLEIARSLALSPNFILLDEPFAGVDPISIGAMQELIVGLKNRGIGVLITDHNVRETLSMVDRAYILHKGQVLTWGTAEDIMQNEDVRKFYLGAEFSL